MAKPELRDHRKFLKLKRLLGEPTPHVLGYLDCLWHRGYQTGSAFVGDALDVEAAAEFPGEAGAFASAALQSGFLDTDADGNFAIHDLFDHAPTYAKKRMKRRGTAPVPAADPVHADTKTPEPCPRGHENGQKPAAWTTEPRAKNQEPRTKNQEPSEVEAGNPPDPPPKPPRKFTPPTVDEVKAYCHERENTIDPERFFDFYVSKGWRVGSEAMKDWKACVRNWERTERDSGQSRGPPAVRNAQAGRTTDADKARADMQAFLDGGKS